MNGLKAYGGGNVVFDGALGTPSYLSSLVVTNATLSFTNGYARLCAASASVSSDAALVIRPNGANHYLETSISQSLAPGSVKVAASSTVPSARNVVYFAPIGVDPDLSAFDTSEMPAGFTLAKTNNVVFMTDGTPVVHDVSAASSSAYYWTGTAGDSLNLADNWTPAAPDNSSKSKSVYFDGWSNLAARITGTLRVPSLYVKASCGPMKITGSTYIRFNSALGVSSSSSYPFIFDCKVGKTSSDGVSTGDFKAESIGSGYIAFVGGPNTSDKNKILEGFGYAGDIRVNGTWSLQNVYPFSASSSLSVASHLTLLPGANFSLSAQSAVQSLKGYYVVSEGATFSVDGTQFAFSSENTHFVDGSMAVSCPFSATALQSFRGRGTLTLASVSDCAGGVELGGSVTLVPGEWGEAPLVCVDTPTIAPASDWTFAPGGDVSLEIAVRSVLTLETGANDVVLSAPISGEGSLVKKGAGRLVLNAPGNVLDSLVVEGGELTFGPALRDAMADGWTTILTVRTLDGELSVPEGFNVAVVRNLDGSYTYSGRRPKGLAIIIN